MALFAIDALLIGIGEISLPNYTLLRISFDQVVGGIGYLLVSKLELPLFDVRCIIELDVLLQLIDR